MKKTWLDYLRRMLTVFVLAAILFQAMPVMAGNGRAQDTLLNDESAYEVDLWSDWTMEGGIYYLVNKKSGLVLDVKGDMYHSEAKAAVQLYEKTEGDNPSQHFRISWTGNGWLTIFPCSNTDLAVNPFSYTPRSGTRINLYEKDVNDNTQGWKVLWDKENEGWIFKCAYDEDLVLTARGTENHSRIVLRKYEENDLAQVWEIEPYREIAADAVSGTVVNDGSCQITLPDSWEGRYFTMETPFAGGLCTEFYSKRCYEDYAGSGRLFSIVTCDEIDYNWPDYIILGSAADRYVVLMRPTDVQFDMSNVDDTNEYLALSNDIPQVAANARCGNFSGTDSGVKVIKPFVYYGHSDEFEAYKAVDYEGRLIETPPPWKTDPEMPEYDRGWFYEPDSDIGRAKNLLLPGMWTATQDMWTEESKAAYPSFSISFNLEGRVDVLDGSGEMITGTYLLNVSEAETAVIALADTNEGKYHLIISMYNGSMEIYGLPEITVENADGSIRKTKTWGFIYEGPLMINDMHGG